MRNFCESQYFDISYNINRLGYQLQHRAIKYVERHNLHSILINNRRFDSHEDDGHDLLGCSLNGFSGKLAETLNNEQKMAVKCILKSDNMLPYLLFGPAGKKKTLIKIYAIICAKCKIPVFVQGTGKTRTLASAVEEIIQSSKNCVLICANSNTACDEIGGRLLKIFGKGVILRMYAKSYDERSVSSELKECSNFQNGQFRFPCLKYIYRFRIVICTLLTAGCLSRALEDPEYDSGHFSHIIIDECASSNETATLIPIAGIFISLLSTFQILIKSFAR